ncbi:uncharacterized protein ofcc1 [Polymixia lowei]
MTKTLPTSSGGTVPYLTSHSYLHASLLFRDQGSAGDGLLQFVEMDTFGSKLQQKALQQPKQKKSKSAEFLMGREERAGMEGIENPAFDGGGSAEPSVSLPRLGREIRGDRPDSTLTAHPKKMELRASAKERGNERDRNYFDPSSAEQTDPRRCRMAGVNAEDELELSTLLAPRDEEVLEVKAGDLVLQRLLHSGGVASGPGPSQADTIAKTWAGAGAGAGLEAGRVFMGRESTVKTRTTGEVIPHYAQQLRERVRPDMITLGSLSLQQVNHNKRPQPVEVSVRCLRAVREKLPRGLYSINVALHSRLGGPALAWSSTKERQQWAGTTEPVEHRGRFNNTDLHINQSLFMIFPAPCEVLPPMVLVFQLMALPGVISHVSSALAWGAYPVCDQTLSPIQGRFKTPLLRGHPSPQLDQFRKIEGLISSDLDHWLCNLYFQVKRLPCGTSGVPERCVALPIPPLPPPLIPIPEVHHGRSTLTQPHSHSHPQPPPRPPSPCLLHPRPQLQPHVGPSSKAGEPAAEHSRRGSPLHLSADSACSSSSLPESGQTCVFAPGPNAAPRVVDNKEFVVGLGCLERLGLWQLQRSEFTDIALSCRSCPRAESGSTTSEHQQQGLVDKKPIKKTNSCGPSVSVCSPPPRQADKQETQPPSTENLSAEEMEEYTFSLQPAPGGPRSCPSRLSDRTRLALRMLPSELGLPLPRQQRRHSYCRSSVRQLGLIMLLLALMWFVRLYLHYCSQWLYLQAMAVPVNKFQFHAHTVDLVYQNSLLHTREELAMVVAGPLTLNGVTFLLVLIRWGCQQIFGSLPSLTSKFIMAQGVWTVLDPLAVFAVDAVLGRLAYSPDAPVGDAAKLYWHFYRNDQSGAAGVVITLFLYAVLFLLSVTILFIYLLRFHHEGRMLDVFQRLSAKEGTYFLPQDLELSNQELSYIVKKAEQWRGFNGERRKVAVYDYIWTEEDPSTGSAPHRADPPGEGDPPRAAGGEVGTHVAVYTLYLSGLRQRYRHFLRQPDGAIVEVVGDMEGVDTRARVLPCPGQECAGRNEQEEGPSSTHRLRKRKRPFWRSHRVEPVGGSGCGSSFALQDISQ